MEENAHQFLDNCDLIIDATDNESTRLLLDRYAQAHSALWLYISVEGGQGQLALFDGHHLAYGDLFPADVEANSSSPSTAVEPIPVMTTTPALLGALAVTEAVKYLLQLPTQLSDSLLLVDGLHLTFQRIGR